MGTYPVALSVLPSLNDLTSPPPKTDLSAKDILKHEWFSKDEVTVTQARKVMGLGLDMSEESNSGRGIMVISKAGKRKSDDSKEEKVFKKGCISV